MSFQSRRLIVLALLVASMALLVPGLFSPVLTIRGMLKPEGIAQVAPDLLEKGLGDDSIASLKAMMNPPLVALLEATGGDLRKMVIEKLGPQLTESLRKNAVDVQIYEQTRSIVGSVRHLYEVRSPLPATLILLFSIIVPVAKAVMVVVALFVGDAVRRQRKLRFIEAIAKWSMADVFAVALLIAYLAGQASQTPAGDPKAPASLVTFTADFGPGFYWFAAYCIFSLAAQQLTTRFLTETAAPGN